MALRFKEHLKNIIRTADSGNYEKNYLCLDRNERQAVFSADFSKKINKLNLEQIIRNYPNQQEFINLLSESILFPKQSIYLSPGADGAIKSVFEALISKGDNVLCLEPTYQMYEVYAKIFRANFKGIRLNDGFNIDIKALKGMVTRCSAIFIANPNQPTGSLLSKRKITEILNLAKKNNALVVIDEAYYPFSECTSIGLVKKYSNLVVIRSFSKAFGMAGLRLGYAVGDKKLINILSKTHSAYPVNNFALAIGSLLLKRPSECLNYVKQVKQSIKTYTPKINKLGCNVLPTHTNFINIQLPNTIRSMDVVSSLRKKKILVRGSYKHPALKNSIRVTVPDMKNMKIFYNKFEHIIKN